MNSGMIIYIEDSEPQRKALKMALELRGFKVEVAGNVANARSLFEKYRGRIDVVVLDMRLEDPEWPQLTGADVAMEYFNPRTSYPPEILINSAYSDVDYYKHALKLGVATYLDKTEYKQADIIRHIRALVIRRALSVKNPEASNRIQKIVESSQNQSEAIEKFCREELAPKFSTRLGTPFIFLLSDSERTFCFSGESGLPENLELYSAIQRMVFSDIQPGIPFILDAGQMPASLAPEENAILRRLDGAAFIRLWSEGDQRLSIGLLDAGPGARRPAEPPVEMANVLADHLGAPFIESLVVLHTAFATKFAAKIEARRKESMRIMAEVCLSVGRNQCLGLQQLVQVHPSLSEDRIFDRLEKQAQDLEFTGNMLASLSKGSSLNDQARRRLAEVSLRDFIESMWMEIHYGNAQNSLRTEGDCKVRAAPEDLSVIIASILQWLAQRFIDTPAGIEPQILVRCGTYDRGVEAIFEDRSERLGKVLRDRLFHPFAEQDGLASERKSNSSLFVARILIEEKYNGVLEDISDAVDVTPDWGHRFRLRFPNSIWVKANHA